MERTTQTSTDLWTYRDVGTIGVEVARGVDLAGFSVEATDGGIGKIDEATYDTSWTYIVVDTTVDLWQEGDAPGRRHRQSRPGGQDCLYVDRSKDEIKNAPELHESRYDEDAYGLSWAATTEASTGLLVQSRSLTLRRNRIGAGRLAASARPDAPGLQSLVNAPAEVAVDEGRARARRDTGKRVDVCLGEERESLSGRNKRLT